MDVATAYYAYAYLKDSNGLQHTPASGGGAGQQSRQLPGW